MCRWLSIDRFRALSLVGRDIPNIDCVIIRLSVHVISISHWPIGSDRRDICIRAQISILIDVPVRRTVYELMIQFRDKNYQLLYWNVPGRLIMGIPEIVRRTLRRTR